MKRRNFIKLTASASALSLLPNEVFAMMNAAGMAACPVNINKKIVLIQLSGANDGLNTVVPLNQYDAYVALRPNIKLNNAGTTNGLINLDTTLATADQVGLHPGLTGFKSLYDAGNMRLVQGVGYPSQDKSHFKSTDLWLNGGDGTSANNNNNSGWIGRFFENYYSQLLTANYPLGIQLGSSDNSLGYHGEVEHGMSMNITGQDPQGFYSVINGLGGTPPVNIPISDYGELLNYIIQSDSSTNVYSQSITNAFNAGTNATTYANTNLSNQLKTVAKFISGGLKSKVYLVKLGGFDTHDIQVATNTTTHTGTHANLLTQLSDAINSFVTDLNNQNLGDDVVAVTFSEFGRKAKENGNLGTDHGEIAPMFVFGKAINPGVSGTNVNLAEAVTANNFQIQTVQHDYRRVFGTILQDWLGTNNNTLDLSFYNNTTNSGYANNKVGNLIKPAAVVPPACYSAQLGNETFEDQIVELLVYPNPTSDIVSVSVNNYDNIKNINMYTIDGRHIGNFINPNTTNLFSIDVQNLSVGLYILNIDTDKGTYKRNLIVKR